MNKKIKIKNKLSKSILESSNLSQLLKKNHLILTISLNPTTIKDQQPLKTTKLYYSIIKNNIFFNIFFKNTLTYSLYLSTFRNQLDSIQCSNAIDTGSLTIWKSNNIYFHLNKYDFENSFVEKNNLLLNECLLSIVFESSK